MPRLSLSIPPCLIPTSEDNTRRTHLFPFPGLSLSGAGSLNRFVAVDTPMSWVKAGQYCRKNYVDLATVRNAEDLQQLYSIKSNEIGRASCRERVCLYV